MSSFILPAHRPARRRRSSKKRVEIENTTPLSDKYLRDVIAYCMPSGLFFREISRVSFDNTRLGWHGRAWPGSMRFHVGVPERHKYRRPSKRGGFRGYLAHTNYTWEEDLVGVVAHELRHLWQYKRGKKLPQEVKRVRRLQLGTSAKLIEVDASLWEIRTVRRYRRERPSFHA